MNVRRKLEILLLAVAVAISRFVFRSHYLYDIDSVNFSLAIQRFDPRVYQPHPPGYFLYICLGRLLNFFTHDANLALVILSIAASIGVVVMIYQLALEWFGPRAALFAGLIFLFSPLAWFHGTVALTYSVEAFFSALLGYLCWRMPCGSSVFTAFTGVILGISAGVRPSSLLFLGPLFLYSLLSVGPRKRVLGMAALGATLLAWFVPMIWASGGFEAYFGALFSLWRLVPSKGTIFNSSPATSIARAATIAFIYLLCFGAAAVAPLAATPDESPLAARKKIFTAVWILPALCFFIFIFLKFVNSGYLLLVMAPASIWLGYWAAQWYENSTWPSPLKQALIATCAAVNVFIFLFAPVYCSYRSVRHFESELNAVRTELPRIGSPDDTLILGVDNHFLGYRHAGYYLPGYLTLEYPEVKLIEGTRIFAMQGGDTRLLTGLPTHLYTRFVLCPLPNGDISYQQYMDKLKMLLPADDLRTVQIGSHEFVTGPIKDLPLLFPETALAPRQSVYSSFHQNHESVNSRIQTPE
jgi:hypothetical protein